MSKLKKIISVAGARPNFMKIAPLHMAFEKYNRSRKDNDSEIKHLICHTGQHYDKKMSEVFFDELQIPEPAFNLGIGSGSHAEQTAGIMREFEKVLLKEKPDLIIVVGDVNSTIACSLTAAKMGIKVAHVESGLRSFDRTMPEEINRILTDAVSDLLFVTEQSGIDNLKRENAGKEKIFFVGNVMIDSLVHFLPQVNKSNILKEYKLNPHEYVLTTMHRPSNVDNIAKLGEMVTLFNKIASFKKIIFPAHPRTVKNLRRAGLIKKLSREIILTEPIGYIDFIALLKNSFMVITDSGGIQEESTYLGVQCVTLRKSTERPITVTVGTNHLLGDDFMQAEKQIIQILKGKFKSGRIPKLWDGNTAERIVKIISESL
ncbi:MAG: UDP-N-acetylglucosamine 2-epimerase (non-hydrolyzing) [Ignavibacteriaceae bacterium]